MKNTLDWIYSDLNEEQQKAVCEVDGPVLILAGAGSGKTRVLTYRIAHILASGKAEPYQILAMTFTNKAAAEMRERVQKLVPEMISGMWIGTFHSLFARLLRYEGEKLGYDSNFSIYDVDDQLTLVKMILEELALPVQNITPKTINQRISAAKNDMILPAEFAENINNPVEEITAKVYTRYEKKLLELNAMDFDDLLIKPIILFEQFPDVKMHYQDKFHYILVDEYQDTNRAQYNVLRLLAGKRRNICVVGDDDQSIYRWRGADVRNILEFELDYPKCHKFRLEQNYRSTKNILAVAHSVIQNNIKRHSKKLWTERPEGDSVTLMNVVDEREEARYIVNQIGGEFRKAERRFYDFAVLYRTNAQSRVIEDALRLDGIPYIIVGGVKFYERKEVKDVLAYLKVLVNPADVISLKRIINFPLRGIGESTVVKLEKFAEDKRISLYKALEIVETIPEIPAKASAGITSFYKLLNKYRSLRSELPPAEIATSLLEETGILKLYKDDNSVESQTRAENIRELIVALVEFSNNAGPEARLEEFLQQVSLITDIDTWDDRKNAVTLMTLHAAKGLEFPVVFITGLEEGLFPLSRSIDDPLALEEERRLFYVGATRAKDKLYLTWAKNRRKYTENPAQVKSRFIKELDLRFIESVASRAAKTPPVTQTRIKYGANDMPDYENQSQEDQEFQIGMRVKHQVFGKGTILKIERGYGTIKLMILFDREGEKRLVYPYAKLEIL
ncbi:MAG TPA: UvrD-helicase domain-containing protein [bacterium]|nr:UvrD-helicase domain-containing protein [bacterium]HPN43287.1 UvrD-helicase domain-containing protein [bacterium]